MTATQTQATLRIGEVATAAGVSVQAVRYYEQRGLLAPLTRTAARYRVFGPENIRIVRFIKRAQELGFALDEIAQLLLLRNGARRERARVRPLAEAKVADMEARIRDLTSIRDGLRTLVERCACGSERASANEACPILDALESDRREAHPRAPMRRRAAAGTAHAN